jgi:EGF domain-specific O-GlcNAc transferase
MLFGSHLNKTRLFVLSSLVLFYFTYFTSHHYGVPPGQHPAPLEGFDQTSSDTLLERPLKTTTIGAKPPYPSDYVEQPLRDEFCQPFFSPAYLDFTASHHVQYCESGSRSSFECYRTNKSDPLCIAKGVILDHARVEPLNATAMDCKLRNFTREAMESPEAAAKLHGVQNVDNMRHYFYSTGVKEQLKQWDFNTSNDGAENQVLCDATHNDHGWILLVKREGNRNIWHKLMELWQSMITLDILQMAVDPSTQKPYLSATAAREVQVVFEDDQIQTVDEWWGIVSNKPPLRKSKMGPSCLGNVVLPLAGSSSPFWMSQWTDRDCHETFLLDAFLRRLYRHIGIQPVGHGHETDIVVTIIDRRGNTRKIFGLERRVEHARTRWPNVTFNTVDFTKLTLKEQVLTARSTDVLVGVIGAGMTHILWLPEESSVAEIMPPNSHYAGFRNLAKMRSLHYFTTHGEDIAANGETHENWVAHESGGTNGTNTESVKRNWQTDEWIYLKDETFQALIDAAIYGQLNRGYNTGDTLPAG